MTALHSEVVPSIRRASDGEAVAIAALINQAFEVETFFVSGKRTNETEVRNLQKQGFFLALDRRAGGLAAVIYLKMSRRRGSFGLLSVHPDYQGSGLGRRLVAVAEAMCEAEGCTAMDLQVVNLRHELTPWYRSLGYRECGTAPYNDDSKLPCHFIRMTKALA